ncbi:MAG: hypothetical protein ACREOF_10305 [Gemmatimonadales bacterium]
MNRTTIGSSAPLLLCSSYISGMRSLRTLLHRIIDYAGLFPPAGLDMSPAVAEYARERAGPDRWALGRFVAPAARLDELGRAAAPCLPPAGEPWRVSALVGADTTGDLATIVRFNDSHGGRAVADAIELKAATADVIAAALDTIGPGFDTYVELPVHADPAELIHAVGQLGARAKIRTGGITADAFPAPPDLLRFIRACVDAGVAFKATAGLHHPLCGGYALTYAAASARAPMYGFLNLFLAAAFMARGLGDAEGAALLAEQSPAAFRFSDPVVEWRGRSLAEPDLARARREVATSFGSCSFREPIDDLRSLGFL